MSENGADVSTATQLFRSFKGSDRRVAALKYCRDESPSQRVGQWLSMHLIEPVFAFDDPDFIQRLRSAIR
jgi:hypothetical protein